MSRKQTFFLIDRNSESTIGEVIAERDSLEEIVKLVTSSKGDYIYDKHPKEYCSIAVEVILRADLRDDSCLERFKDWGKYYTK